MFRKTKKSRFRLKTPWFDPNNLTDRPIVRPKGMHRKTFDRLKAQELELKGQCLSHLSVSLDKLENTIN